MVIWWVSVIINREESIIFLSHIQQNYSRKCLVKNKKKSVSESLIIGSVSNIVEKDEIAHHDTMFSKIVCYRGMETVLTEPNDPLELVSVSPTSESQTVSPATQTDASVIETY